VRPPRKTPPSPSTRFTEASPLTASQLSSHNERPSDPAATAGSHGPLSQCGRFRLFSVPFHLNTTVTPLSSSVCSPGFGCQRRILFASQSRTMCLTRFGIVLRRARHGLGKGFDSCRPHLEASHLSFFCFFAVLGRSPDWMIVVQSGERSRVENVRI
jgi:hypothetical protein